MDLQSILENRGVSSKTYAGYSVPSVIANAKAPELMPSRRAEIPRNAFIFYRSHIVEKIREKQIREGIEKDQWMRQDVVSKVAGECWQSLSSEERKPWYEKADEERRKMCIDGKPLLKRKRRAPRRRGTPHQPNIDEIHSLREKYMGPTSPRSPSPRGHRSRTFSSPSADSSASLSPGRETNDHETMPSASSYVQPINSPPMVCTCRQDDADVIRRPTSITPFALNRPENEACASSPPPPPPRLPPLLRLRPLRFDCPVDRPQLPGIDTILHRAG